MIHNNWAKEARAVNVLRFFRFTDSYWNWYIKYSREDKEVIFESHRVFSIDVIIAQGIFKSSTRF